MIEKLKAIKDKFDKLAEDIANPEVISDMKTWQAKVKEHANLTELMEEYDKYVKMKKDFDDAEELLSCETDAEMREMLKEEHDYFEYLVLGTKVIWDEEKIYFLLENGDFPAIMENQRISKIKLSNLSNEYRENVEFIANDICPEIGKKTIRNIIKEL